MDQSQIDAILAELKAVLDKHGVSFSQEIYDGGIELIDHNREQLTECVDLETMTAQVYVPVVYGPRDPNIKPADWTKSLETMQDRYLPAMEKKLSEASPLLLRMLERK